MEVPPLLLRVVLPNGGACVLGKLGGDGAAGQAEPCLYSPCCIRIQAGVAGRREAQWQEECVCGCVCVCVSSVSAISSPVEATWDLSGGYKGLMSRW